MDEGRVATKGSGSAPTRRARRRLLLLVAAGVVLMALAGGVRNWLWNPNWIPDDATLANLPLAELLSLTQKHPQSEAVYFALGLRLQREGRLFEAVTAFEQASVNDPRSARALEQAAAALAEARQFTDAAHHFEWCLRVDPARLSARRALAVLYQTVGSWNRAADQFAWLADYDREDAETWFRLGQCLAQIGQRRHALEALGRAARLSPGNEAYRLALRREMVRPRSGGSP
jgi:tetratricopeptide (TPR) repeat protein